MKLKIQQKAFYNFPNYKYFICGNISIYQLHKIQTLGYILILHNHLWLQKPYDLWPQAIMAASGHELGVLWLQWCCGSRPKPTLAAAGRKISSVISKTLLRNIWLAPIIAVTDSDITIYLWFTLIIIGMMKIYFLDSCFHGLRICRHF